jgi:hypothetical protein
VRSPPEGLETRGRWLWAQVTTDDKLTPLEVVLVEEACRTVDRLDRLDRVLRGSGNEWITLAAEVEGRSEVAVVIDAALSEARQQAGRLTSILAELRQRAGVRAGTAAPAPATTEVPDGVASIIGRARAGPRAG